MPTNAAVFMKGVQKRAGRKGKGSGAANGFRGDGTTTTPLGRAHGGAGRDERSAARFAGYGNQITSNPSAHGHPYK